MVSESAIRPGNDAEIAKRVEDAARIGAREGVKEASKSLRPRGSGVISTIIRYLVFLVIVAAAIYIVLKVTSNKLAEQFEVEAAASEHDLVLEDNGFFGYTAADFAEAVLGKAEQQTALQVYKREISEATTLTKAGLAKIKAFSKYQIITYHGTATYTVDLSKLTKNDITLDDESQTVTIKIPKAHLEPINIPSENIEFGDVSRGLLAIGEISLEPEELAKIETEAKNKMLEKLENENTIEEANRFARLSVLEMYQPIIKSVAKNYSLVVEFQD